MRKWLKERWLTFMEFCQGHRSETPMEERARRLKAIGCATKQA